MSNSNKYSIAVEARKHSGEDCNTPYHARLVIHEISSDEEHDGSDSSSSLCHSQDKDAGRGNDDRQYTSKVVSPTNSSKAYMNNKDIFENYCFVEDLKEVTPPPIGRKTYRYNHDKQNGSLSGSSRSRKGSMESQKTSSSNISTSRHHHRRNSCAFKFENPISIADR